MKLTLKINNLSTSSGEVEIVERKGLGHPDTICDLVVDNLSIKISQIYRKEFGQIPHFNIDKALLAAGKSKNKFGGGKVVKPMLFVIGDRATSQVGRKKINLGKIIKEETFSFLESHYRFINKKNFVIQNEVKPGSPSLQDIFRREKKYLPANDTSALVGFSPLTDLERMVFKVERFINAPTFKRRYPGTGEDVKIMGQRIEKNFKLTIAIAFIDRFIKNEDDYFDKKRSVKMAIKRFLKKSFPYRVEVLVNTLDEGGKGVNGCYLTVLGTSADSADSGEVGRGNQANGLISLNRPSGSEAAAGKNCISHVGKIYNLLAFKMASEIYKKVGKANYVWLLSQIGQPVDKPQLVSVEVKNLKIREKDIVSKIIEKNFKNLDKFIDSLILGKYRIQQHSF